MKNSFKLLEEKRGSLLSQGCLFLILGPLFWLQPRSLCQNLSRKWRIKTLILACITRICPKGFSVKTIMSSKDGLTSTFRLGLPSEMACLWTIDPCFMITLAE